MSLEVVEVGHQGCHFEGESLAVIEKVRADDVVPLVEAAVGRRRGNGEVVLGEGVVSAGKELLEVAETLEAVLVIEGERLSFSVLLLAHSANAPTPKIHKCTK